MSEHEILNAGRATTEQAFELFDSLEPVDVSFMIGGWNGEGLHTGHHMDGLLEAYHWYGKRFENLEDVHPLVFLTLGGDVVYVNPACIRWSFFFILRREHGGQPSLAGDVLNSNTPAG